MNFEVPPAVKIMSALSKNLYQEMHWQPMYLWCNCASGWKTKQDSLYSLPVLQADYSEILWSWTAKFLKWTSNLFFTPLHATKENFIFGTTPGTFLHLSNKKREGKPQVTD